MSTCCEHYGTRTDNPHGGASGYWHVNSDYDPSAGGASNGSSSRPFTTLDELFEMANQGYTDIRGIVDNSNATYTVSDTGQYFNGITLHLNIPNEGIKINFAHESESVVFYNCHINLHGNEDSNCHIKSLYGNLYFENTAFACENIVFDSSLYGFGGYIYSKNCRFGRTAYSQASGDYNGQVIMAYALSLSGVTGVFENTKIRAGEGQNALGLFRGSTIHMRGTNDFVLGGGNRNSLIQMQASELFLQTAFTRSGGEDQHYYSLLVTEGSMLSTPESVYNSLLGMSNYYYLSRLLLVTNTSASVITDHTHSM